MSVPQPGASGMARRPSTIVGGSVTRSSFLVDVYFHDAHVWKHGAEARTDERCEVTVVVVRGDVQLMNFGEVSDFFGL